MDTLNLLDVVELTEDVPAEGLRRGQRGTVVDDFASDAFLVEFCDAHGAYRLARATV